jgi:hypothetical protein
MRSTAKHLILGAVVCAALGLAAVPAEAGRRTGTWKYWNPHGLCGAAVRVHAPPGPPVLAGVRPSGLSRLWLWPALWSSARLLSPSSAGLGLVSAAGG